MCSGDAENQEKSVAFTANGDLIPASVDFNQLTKKPKNLNKSRPRLELQNESEVSTLFNLCFA